MEAPTTLASTNVLARKGTGPTIPFEQIRTVALT